MKKEDSQHNTDKTDDIMRHDESLMRNMLRMSQHRKEIADDTDEAWNDFRRTVIGSAEKKRRFGMLHLAIASLCGAAAMLAILFAAGFMTADRNIDMNIPDNVYVALQHKQSPQQVSLETDGKTTTVNTNEPISFCAPPTSAANSAGKPDKFKKISTPRGMGVKVILPDSSEVWLNADSYIEFPETFRKGSRIVAVNGEAFFKITHDETSPFIVKSSQLDVRVLGTEFNFNNYNTDNTQVALVSGKVEILPPAGSQPIAVLSPGEAATCGENGMIDVDKVDTYALTQWVDGFFYFDDVPLVEVLQELGRWYNYGVIFSKREVMHKKVHFSAMRTEPLERALESLNNLRIVKIRIKNHDIIVD